MFRLIITTTLVSFSVACGGAPGSTETTDNIPKEPIAVPGGDDAGSPALLMGHDSGTLSPTEDAGSPMMGEDSGKLPAEDAKAPSVDSGMPLTDATPDSGASLEDAGSPPSHDAGTTLPEAGSGLCNQVAYDAGVPYLSAWDCVGATPLCCDLNVSNTHFCADFFHGCGNSNSR